MTKVSLKYILLHIMFMKSCYPLFLSGAKYGIPKVATLAYGLFELKLLEKQPVQEVYSDPSLCP